MLLLYDSDEAGVKAALRAIPILREAGVNSRVVNLRPHKDPDEFIKAEGAEAVSYTHLDVYKRQIQAIMQTSLNNAQKEESTDVVMMKTLLPELIKNPKLFQNLMQFAEMTNKPKKQ